jgi:small conductance mechanosensitive channel
LKAIYAIIVLIIGYIIIAIIGWVLRRALKHTKMDPLVQSFLSRLIVFVLKLLLWTFIIGIIELDILSVSSLIAAVGVAVGFTLSGLLGNFISGCILLTKKPFGVGDYVVVAGTEGVVKTIDLFMTVLTTGDNKVVYVPNGTVASGTIVNVTAEEKRRVDLTISIPYDADIEKATKVLAKVCKRNKLVLRDPETVIKCSELSESSVNLVCRPWCKTSDYWTVRWALLADIKDALADAGIEVPFPQLDVHLFDGVKPEPKELDWSDDEDEADAVVAKPEEVKTKESALDKAKAHVSNAANKAKSALKSLSPGSKKKKEEEAAAAAAAAEAKKKAEEEEDDDEEEEEYEYEYETEVTEEEEEETEEEPEPDTKKSKKSKK